MADTVLIVEDDSDIRDSLREVLQWEGMEVLEASDGEAALKLLRSGARPRLILLDDRMPRLSGRGFLEQRLKDAALREIPTFVLTAMRVSYEEYSIQGVFRKPLDLEELLAAVHKIFGQPQS